MNFCQKFPKTDLLKWEDIHQSYFDCLDFRSGGYLGNLAKSVGILYSFKDDESNKANFFIWNTQPWEIFTAKFYFSVWDCGQNDSHSRN